MISRRELAVGAMALCSAVAAIALYVARPEEAQAQRCNRSCPASERDARGCCRGNSGAGGRVACAANEHRSAGHCCGAGEEWVAARRACVCLEPAACGAATGSCPDGMVSIPAGSFWMGSQDRADEQPVHRVTLSAYCIGRTEVTVAEYAQCVASGRCSPADTDLPYCTAGRADRASHPINCVDHQQAVTYCAWRGGRLPTEAQWEYAARGADGRRYPWGNQPPGPSLLNVADSELHSLSPNRPVMFDASDGYGSTAPVGSYPAGASPFGVLDMAGNVWEWVSDWADTYPAGEVRDPAGPRSGQIRVYRGGGWYDSDPDLVRAARRLANLPTLRSDFPGFRCAQSQG